MRFLQLITLPGHLLRRAQQTITAIFTQAMAEAELTSVQFLALVAIDDFPGLDATRLAEQTFTDKATIGGVIERLTRKGLIERRTSPHDKRAKILATTPAGRAMITVCFDRVGEVQKQFLAPLDESEKALFLSLLQRLIEGQPST
jgi:DNA-binding MarR family transcriptional regulator